MLSPEGPVFDAYPAGTLVDSVRSSGMDDAVDAATLGSCPGCGAEIPPDRLVVRYLTADERARVLAECPECSGIGAPLDDGGEG